MARAQTYFSKTYQEASDKFTSATAKANQKFEEEITDSCSINCAVYEKSQRKNLVMLTSGVHGIEGFAGSAVQLLFLEKFLEKFLPISSVALVHAINPWGFAHQRRTNENNVDLNRAFYDLHRENLEIAKEDRQLLSNIYAKLAPVRVRRHHYLEKTAYYLNAISAITRYGYRETKAAVLYGQNHCPKTIIFKGFTDRSERSVEAYTRILRKITDGYSRVIHLDFHTGLGKRYQTECIGAHETDSPEFNFMLGIVPQLSPTSDYTIKGLGKLPPPLRHDLLIEHTVAHSKAEQTCSFIVDFGTISAIRILQCTVAENQVYHYSETPDAVKRLVKKEFVEAFYPSEKKWRASALSLSTELFERMYRKLEAGS